MIKKIILTLLIVNSITQAHIDDKVLYAFEARCMGCHDTYKKNRKAPPLVAVNQVYLRLSDNNFSLAMEEMKEFLANPNIDKTLMKPAVKLFGVMPNLELNSTEIGDFSQVLVETEFEIPDWFNAHYKSHELNNTMKIKL